MMAVDGATSLLALSTMHIRYETRGLIVAVTWG
jgi:hypothetical protein